MKEHTVTTLRNLLEAYDARLRTLERAWKHRPSEEALERYVVALLRSSDGPHEIPMGSKVLFIEISDSPWYRGGAPVSRSSKAKELVFFSVEDGGAVTTKGWGPNLKREVASAVMAMFEDVV